MPKPAVAAELGVSTDVIAETVRVATIGDVGAESARSSTPATARSRSACSCPRAARGDLRAHRRAQGAGEERRRRAALGRRRCRARPGADLHRPLRPRACAWRSRPTCDGTDALGEVLDAGQGAADRGRTCRPASPSSETGDAEVMAEVFAGFAHGDGRRHHDGARRAGAAVRELPAADHHPVVAAAVDRRRDPRRCSSRRRRSRCRWSSAS